MQSDSRSSSTASPPPIEASEESDFYAQPNDSTTSVMVDDCAKAAEEGTVVSAEPSAASAYAELDFDRTKIHRLPNELLMYIFGKFDSPTDVFVCMLVCKRWARHSVDLLWHRPACTSGPNLYSISEVLAKDRPFFSYRLFVRRLNLSGLSAVVDDSHLEPLAVCSRLERLTLSNCNLITDLSLAKMVSNAPSLLALDASQVTKITGESINKLAENCPRLQGLNITNCLNVSNASLINLAEHCRYIKRVRAWPLSHTFGNARGCCPLTHP
jgi:F-box and leucine-rich repeat protein GRR1